MLRYLGSFDKSYDPFIGLRFELLRLETQFLALLTAIFGKNRFRSRRESDAIFSHCFF